MTDLNNFPQHVLNRAEAASEMAYEGGGEVAGEMAFDAILEAWMMEHHPRQTGSRKRTE